MTWGSDGQDSSGNGIYAQRYGANGQAQGAEFKINTTTAGNQYGPSITALSDGGFVVTWVSYGQDGSGLGIYAQRYGANGQPQGIEFRVNTTTANDQNVPNVTALINGGFVITWNSKEQNGSGYDDVYAQRYGANGQAQGAEFQVNTFTTNYQSSPSITALTDGGFVVTWMGSGSNGWGIYAQRYDAQGNTGFETATHADGFVVNAGSQVVVTVNGVALTATELTNRFATSTDANGQTRYTARANAFDGSETVVVNATLADAAGNVGSATPITLKPIDTTAPVLSLSAVADADNASFDSGFVVAQGASVTVKVNGVVLTPTELAARFATSTDASGQTTYTAKAGAFAGTEAVVVTASSTLKDSAGNLATPATLTLKPIDTTAPTVALSAVADADNSALASGFVAPQGAAVSVSVNGTALTATELANRFASSSAGGQTTYTAKANAFVGSETVTVNATLADSAGNVGSATPMTLKPIDTTAPVLSLSAVADADNASFDSGFVVAQGAIVSVKVNGTALTATELATRFASSTASGQTTYTAKANAFVGTETVTVNATQTDSAGNAATPATLTLKPIDTTAPTVTLSAVADADNANFDSGFVTPQGAAVSVSVNGTTLSATELANRFTNSSAGGQTTYTAKANAFVGSETVTVNATLADSAGNVGTATPITLKPIDTTAPALDMDRTSAGSGYQLVYREKNASYLLNNRSVPNQSDALITDSQPVTRIDIGMAPVAPLNGSYERLQVGDQEVPLNGVGIPASVNVANLTWSLSYNAGTLTLQPTSGIPADTLAAQALLRNLRYINTSAGAVGDTEADRVFTIQVYDRAGNASNAATVTLVADGTGPVVDLNGSATGGLDLAQANLSRASVNAGVTLAAASATVTEGRTVNWLQVGAQNLLDGALEVLNVGSVSLRLDGVGVGANTALSVSGVDWQASYLAGEGLRFALASGTAATTTQAQALLQGLSYQHKGTNSTMHDGPRVLLISAQDSVGNLTASPAQATLAINANLPAANTLSTAAFTPATATTPAQNSNGQVTTLDANGDGKLGDQFTVSFSEMVRTSSVTVPANWTLSSGTLGTDATITAIDPVTLNGVQYAKSYLFKGGTGYSYTSGTTLTLAKENVVGSGGVTDTPAVDVVFTMTDIVPRSAVTPPLNIATDNTVSASEKATGVAMAYDMGSALLAGETVKIYRNGVDITNASGVAISGNSVGSSTVTFTLSSAAWPEGAQSITVRHIDAAGNMSPVGFAKAVTVDTAIGSISSLSVTTDSDNLATAGDVITVTFSEAVSASGSSATLTLPAGVFGTGATVTAVDAVNNKATTYRVTLGTGATLAAGDVLTFTGLQDAAGNTGGTASITVPADVYSAPTSITVANVGTANGAWNVIDSADRSGTGVTVNFTKAAENDVVKLVIDGDSANPITHTLTAGEAAAGSINFAALNWGADGTRSITASIQRGAGTVVNSAVRKVQVSADSEHWSRINDVIWLDPDALTATAGSKIASWADSSGRGVSAIQNTTAAQPWVQTNEFGGKMVWVNGGQAMSLTSALLPTGLNYNLTMISAMQLLANPSWAFVLVAGGSRSWALGSTSASDTTVTNTLVLDSDQPGASDGNLTMQNSISFNRWAAISGQVQHGITAATRSSQVYSNGNLVMQGTNYALVTDLGATGQVVIGAKNASASANIATAMLGDQVVSSVSLGNAARMEIETYISAKFGSGVPAALNVSNEYNLTLSSVAGTIVDDRLDISTQVSNDRVTIKGADHVNTGAGTDTVLAQDLAFRWVDGGTGFDTFALDSAYTAGTFILTDYVSNARGLGADTAANTRVNANGYHKLQGFEKLDFSQSMAKQTITISAADVDQLAEKGLSMNMGATPNTTVTVNATTSNLFAVLGTNDHIVPTGFGAATYGYFVDAVGTVYDRKYSATVGSDTANLYVRSGDDAPDFGFTSTAGTYSTDNGSIGINFGEDMLTTVLTGGDFTVTSAGAGKTVNSVNMTATALNISTGGGLSGAVRIQYTGSAILDTENDQLRYKDITLGSSVIDEVNMSSATAPVALLGNNGYDVLTGGSGNDLLMGMVGNDSLSGGAGADTFRFIQFESGIDTITDFEKSAGDKLDLRGILMQSGFDSTMFSNLSNFLNLSKDGGNAILKIDDQGIGNFSQPAQTVILIGAAQDNNLVHAAKLLDLNTLIDQRVFLV